MANTFKGRRRAVPAPSFGLHSTLAIMMPVEVAIFMTMIVGALRWPLDAYRQGQRGPLLRELLQRYR